MSTIVPEDWMPACQVERIIVHWTAGGSTPSAVDLEHYHLLLDRKGKIYQGDFSIRANVNTADRDYAAHTRHLNTASVGLSLCGMANAQQNPFRPGPYPLTRGQWNNAILAAADLCRRYMLTPTKRRLLMHCEVEEVYGIVQAGKWDISKLVFDRGTWAGMSPGDELRARVEQVLLGD